VSAIFASIIRLTLTQLKVCGHQN